MKIEVTELAKVTMKTWLATLPNDYDAPNPCTVLVGFEVIIAVNANAVLLVKLIPQNAKQTSEKIPELKEWSK